MLTIRIYFYCQLVVVAAILALIPSTVKAFHPPESTHRILKSASELDYPPFALVRPDGSADGFSVDLLKAVTQAVGLEVNLSVGPWHEIKQKLVDRHLDVLPLVSFSKEREKMFDFTFPYLRMHGTIFVRKEEKSIRSITDLKDKEVLVMRGDTAHEYAVTENLSNKLVLTDSFEEAMKLLSEGKHDAVIVQQLVGLQLLKKLGISNVVSVRTLQETSLKPVGKPLLGFEQKFCFAVQEGDKELLALLNEGLAIVSANGTYNELYNKWFSPILPKPPIPLTLIIKYLLFILGPILFFLAVAGFWYLKREVTRKTLHLQQEIEERKRAEEALRESELKYKTLTENSIAGIFIHQDDKYVYVNNKFAEMHGYKADELFGINHYDLIHPDQRELIKERAYKRLEGEQVSKQYEIKRLHKNGHVVWHEIMVGDPIIYKGNYAIMGHEIDITERKWAEDAFKESEEQYRLLAEISPYAIILHSGGNIRYVNPAGVKMFRVSDPDELIGRSYFDLIYPGDVEKSRERFQKVFDERWVAPPRQHRVITPACQVFEVESTGSAYKHKGKTIIQTIMQDITERKKLEAQLQQAQKMESIGTLAGGIAHDFNNILSPIMIHSEMAMMELPSGSPLQQSMKQIYKAGVRASDLVKQILTFARKQEKDRVPIKISRILKEAIKLLRSTIPTTIDIQYDISSDQDTVLSDPTQLNQIIMNLCTNAAHAMEENGGTLEVILNNENLGSESADEVSDLDPGRYVKLTVKDTGQGIEPQFMDKIFEPYFTTKEVGKGTGMGLALVHGIVKSYGGAVTVQSEVGKGTSLHVYLPLLEDDTDLLETANDSVQLPIGTERILFVDDERVAVDTMQTMFEKLGYKVTARTSSIEALEAFRNNPQGFDLVITDMTMPNMTGKDLAKELMVIRPDIPIILCTGFSEKIDERKSEEMGISAFVMKPIVMGQIANTIREVLDKK